MASWNCGRLGRKSTLLLYSTTLKTNESRTALLPTLPSSTGKTARDDTMRESLRRRKRHMRRRLRVSRTVSTVSTNEVHDGSGTGLDMNYSTEHELSRLSTVCSRQDISTLGIFIAALGNTKRSLNPPLHHPAIRPSSRINTQFTSQTPPTSQRKKQTS